MSNHCFFFARQSAPGSITIRVLISQELDFPRTGEKWAGMPTRTDEAHTNAFQIKSDIIKIRLPVMNFKTTGKRLPSNLLIDKEINIGPNILSFFLQNNATMLYACFWHEVTQH